MKALGLAVGIALTAVIGTAPAHADIIGNCERHPWGFLGLTQERVICDGPIQPDGSWMRRRVIGVPGHWVSAGSDCSYGSYSSHCSYHDGYYQEEIIKDDETYPVRPETVLPDEPGHLG
jgi:hypothetical protein